ncbi:MAG: M28 family peptidase [Bacilli bacterium]
MVRFIRFLAMFALVVSTFVSGSTVSAAESGSSYNFGEANIYVNGQPFLTKVSKFTYNNTTYMSIYSVQLLINKLLGTTNLNGDIWRGDAWDITDTKVTPKILFKNTANTSFNINGVSVLHVPVIVTTAPGGRQATSYVPVWYVQQLMNELLTLDHTTDVWNGSQAVGQWTLTTASWPPLNQYVPDAKYAYNVVKEVSGSKYQGRRTGTQGYTAAAQYTAGLFAQLGLSPAGDPESFLQPYQTTLAQYPSDPTLSINGQPLKFLTDFKGLAGSESGTVSGNQVMFMGDGQPSVYSGVNVSGKIVMFTGDEIGHPSAVLGIMDRVEYARKQGAAAVLVVAGTQEPMLDDEHLLSGNNWGVVSYYVSPQVAQSIGANLTSETAQPLSARVQGSIQINRTKATGYNVLGFIRGKDPTRTVILEANLDGFGSLPDGTVFPGAGADGSGVGDVVGLAEYYRSLKTEPDINILFALFGGNQEECDGSQWFLQHHSQVPGKLVADLNLYDVGGPERPYIAVNHKYTQLDTASNFAVKDTWMTPVQVQDSDAASTGSYGNFDNANMDMAGIPNIFVRTSDSTTGSTNGSWHDDISGIQLQSLQDSMEFAKNVVFWLEAVNDPQSVYDASQVKQVYVPQVGHSMYEYDTAHFRLFFDADYANDVPHIVPLLDPMWDQNEWLAYGANPSQKGIVYLTDKYSDLLAVLNRTGNAPSSSGGMTNSGLNGVGADKDAGNWKNAFSTVTHEWGIVVLEHREIGIVGNKPLNPDGITQQDQVDIPNSESITHMTPWTFANLEDGGASLANTVFQAESMVQSAPDANAIDWTVYNGTGVANQGAAQEPGFDLLGSLYAYVWAQYGPEKDRELGWDMYYDNRNLEISVQSVTGVPFQQVESDWFTWMKAEANSVASGSGSGGGSNPYNGEYETVTYAPEASFNSPIVLPSSTGGIQVTDTHGNAMAISGLGLDGTSTLRVIVSGLQPNVKYILTIQPGTVHYASGGSYPQTFTITFTYVLSSRG